MNYWFLLLAVFLGFLLLLVITLIAKRKTTNQLVEDLDLVRHVWVTWFFAPIFRFCFWFLELVRRMERRENCDLPWDEGFIVAPNHPLEKVEDGFVLPMTFFFLRPKNFLNPIRWFAVSAADAANFAQSRFFKIIGPQSLIAINRDLNGMGIRTQAKQTLERIKNQYSAIIIMNPEAGRTLTAIVNGRYKTMVTPEGDLYLGNLKRGVAELSLATNKPIVPVWIKLRGDDSCSKVLKDQSFKPLKASPLRCVQGLLELLVNPRKKLYIDIGCPGGPIRPKVGEETSEELTQRLEDALFEIGHLQLRRIKSKR